MSTYQQKPETGALFANPDRTKETQPNAKGSALIDGVEYWVSAWTNTSSKGIKYQSLKFERKDQKQEPAPQIPDADFGDEVPF